jgi:MerR family transcriptional regulator, light-induced transcriptional regulator
LEHDDIPSGTYPMRVATRLSGLSAATVRAWERRYGAVVPDRTEGNARRYSADQVRRLILLRRAIERGHAIGDVARLPTEQLEEISEATAAPEPGRLPDQVYRQLIDDYLHELDGFEARAALEILSRTAALLPPHELVFQLVLPLLGEVGARWERGDLSVAHEHMVSGHLKGLLGTLVRLQAPSPGGSKVVLATPPGELHEFGALVGAFVAAGHDYEAVYLGPDLPWSDLSVAVDRSGTDLVVLSVVHDMGARAHDTLDQEVRALAERVEIWIGLRADHPVARLGLPARMLHRYEDLDAALLHRHR